MRKGNASDRGTAREEDGRVEKKHLSAHRKTEAVRTYRVGPPNVTRIWINRLLGQAKAVWQFLPFPGYVSGLHPVELCPLAALILMITPC